MLTISDFESVIKRLFAALLTAVARSADCSGRGAAAVRGAALQCSECDGMERR
jgi:hypothetical protein